MVQQKYWDKINENHWVVKILNGYKGVLGTTFAAAHMDLSNAKLFHLKALHKTGDP